LSRSSFERSLLSFVNRNRSTGSAGVRIPIAEQPYRL